MNDASPATLVWIAPDPPDAVAERALLAWARSHGVTFAWPRDERPAALPTDASVADQVEDLLDRARDATAARDGDATDRATAAAESLLRGHPELPQGGWLMAEIERARSTRSRRADPADAAAAERDWAGAEALDGGRVPGIAETAATSHPADAQLTLEFPPELPDEDGAWLDGQTLSLPRGPSGGQGTNGPGGAGAGSGLAGSLQVATHAGTHALVVTAGGRPVWARWIDVAPGASALAIDAPLAPACSFDDTARARIASDRVMATHVRCASWIAAAPARAAGATSALRIAVCAADGCGPPVEWREPAPWTLALRPGDAAGGAAEAAKERWPAWATWAVVGAGAAVAAGVAVVASGALRSAPTETPFVSGGLKRQ